MIVVLGVLCGAAWLDGCEDPETADAKLREELLAKTPRGTSAPDVLAFVADLELPKRAQCTGYGQWVRNYEASTGRRTSLIPADDRTIEAMVKIEKVVLGDDIVKAIWHFDESDRLTDITIDRYTIGF